MDWTLDRLRHAAREKVVEGLRKKDGSTKREDMDGLTHLDWTAARALLRGKWIENGASMEFSGPSSRPSSRETFDR